MITTAKTLFVLARDASEAVLFALNFDRAADQLWENACDRVYREASRAHA